MRPSHWLKNGFIFVPLIYSKTLFETPRLVDALLAFLLFSLASSVIYILNDIVDRDADREHPVKKNRPIASGEVSSRSAIIQLLLLLPIIALILLQLPSSVSVLVGVYFILNLGYSFGLKHVILLDVFIVASGFMLRVLVGAYAIDVPVSSWLVICTLFLALFLAIAKRRSEINNLERGDTRRVLDDYTPDLVRTILIVSVTGSIMSYTLYTMSADVVARFGTENLIYTVPIVMFGIFRYLHLDERSRTAENPVSVVLRDPSLVLTGLAWVLTSLLVIYTAA